ncbi:sugar transferase [Geodermatophilus ruber]|uniref:Exopolysaccharide biosynthesis polyprenyl glycosylphosphotransferase n=1 Tax=Geodermatophilus ruber TaxID=504800 RepID=A0A1I4BRN7_9ACTN|nr:sugar transferase [Geodermatophilus ruber]SFK70646.1 exopolysaccharide biosynthesis polyprenyl glycosylphosphotransferase [Geodermatophilus ruber]
MIDVGGRQVRELLDPEAVRHVLDGSVRTAPRPDAAAPHLPGAEPREYQGASRALLMALDAVALALPTVWLGTAATHVALLLVGTLAVLAAFGSHRPRISLSALDEAPRHLTRLALGLLLVAPVAHAGGADLALAVHVLWALPCFVAGRSLGYALVRGARRRRLVGSPTLVLGGGRLGMDLLTTLDEHPEYGLRGIGFLSSGSPLDEREPLGRMEDLALVLDTYGVRKVVVAYGPTREAELVGLVRTAAERDIEVYIVPRFFDVGLSPNGPDVEDLWGIPLHRVRRAALRRGVWRVKRLIDVVVSGAALTLLAPLMGLLALAVRISSPGPILFRQPRTGHDGEEISILKFRTLRPAGPGTDAGATTGSTRSTMHARQIDVECRQTRIGNLLRRTSLDELPQLWNILRGDMSLVGPRPEERRYAAQFADSVYGYRDRHRLAVGLTGWAQIHGLRGDTSIEERARFDNSYIEHWSLWRDIVILIRTAAAVHRQAFTAVRSAAR